MAELRATPMVNPVMGLLADRLKKVQQFGAKPFGYENPPVEMLMNLLGVPAVQQTMERMAYGEPLTTGRGMTTKPRAEAVEAAMTIAPVAGLLGKATKGLPVGASIKNVGEELIYHGTTPKAAKAIEKSGFDVSKSADGTIWFTSNPNIGEVAATGKGAVVKRFLNEKKMKLGGWDDTDKYSTDELIQKGFDGLKLVDDETGEITYQIFNPEKLSVNKSYSYPQQEALDTAQEGLLATQREQPMQGLLQSKIPSPSSLTMPDVPTIEQMQKYGRVETVPLSQAVSFQSARNWDKFNKGEHVGDLVQGFGDKPLALRLENGEYVIYDGNHRTDLAMQAGKTELPMNVIDVKSYDPAHAGRKPVPPTMSDDELLRSLLE